MSSFFIKVPVKSTDIYEVWKDGYTLPYVSNIFYKSPMFSRYILRANPKYLNEFEINDGAVIRIPYPKDE